MKFCTARHQPPSSRHLARLFFFVVTLAAVLAAAIKIEAQSTPASTQSMGPQSLLLPQTPAIRRYGVMVKRSAASSSSGTITPACNSPKLSYFSGPVISNVQVVPVFWGNYVNSQITGNISQFYSDATVSNWYDMLSEYASEGGTNQSIGRGTAVSAITINPSKCPSSSHCTLNDSDVQNELSAQIQNGNLPQPQQDSAGNTNTVYMVYFPPTISLQGPSGTGTSCVQFCGYHNTAKFGSAQIALPYGVIMDTVSATSACSTGCGSSTATGLENETSLSAHELAEAVTDTNIGFDTQSNYAAPAAWADNSNSCGEVADICDTNAPGSTITGANGTWVVQQLWSNKLNACVGTGLHPNYTVSAPSTAGSGTALTFTVTAKNPSGSQGADIAYVGTVHFTSSDSSAALPADYAFAPTDQGTASFSATLKSQGSQTITATDTLNGSIAGISGAISVNLTVPGAPSIGVATAGDTQATVAFSAPTFDGGAALTGYTATANPGGATGSCAASPCTVTGLTNGTAFTFTVTATNSAGTGAASASSNAVTPRGSQMVTFNNPGAQTFGTSPTLAATATSGLAVTFTSSASGICTITSGGALKFVSTGTCIINVDQAGNNAYLAAATVSQSFMVNAGTATVTLSSLNQTYTGSPVTATATTNPAGLAVNLTYNGSTTPRTTVNSYTVVATISDPDYQGSAAGTLLISKATPAISWATPASMVYGTALDAAQLNATASVPGTFSYSAAAGTVLGEGTHTLTATFTPTDAADYTTATQTVALTVTSATLQVTANNATKVYGTVNPTISGTVTGAQNGDSFTESFSTSAVTSSPVGSYAIVPVVTGANLVAYTQSVTNGTLTVTKAGTTTVLNASNSGSIGAGTSLTLTAQVASATTGTPTGTVSFYDGSTLLGTATLSNGAANYSTAALTTTATHTLSATYGGDANFTGSTTASSVSVVVSPLDFSFQAVGPLSVATAKGGTATFAFTIAPMNGGYPGPVNFTVSAPSTDVSYSLSQTTIAANAGPQTITLTVTTNASTAAVRERQLWGIGGTAVALGLLFPLGTLRPSRQLMQSAGRRLLLALLVVAASLTVLGLSGCGSRGNRNLPQSYSVTVTAASGSVTHNSTVSVLVR